jgi:Fic family protein
MSLEIGQIPSFEFTQKIAQLQRRIDEHLRDCRTIGDKYLKTKLRKVSRLKSINSSLAIEANSLTLETMQDIIDGKLVEGPFDEVLEAKNASAAYELMNSVDLTSVEDFLKIESVMMYGLVPVNGFRDCKVGVRNGEEWEYIAPPAEEVPAMVGRLFDWYTDTGFSPCVSGAIVHYYLEAIHPFRDGNGRMGRIWHNEILRRSSRCFELISVENLIYEQQEEYYSVLKECQDDMDCTPFVEFCMVLIERRLAGIARLSDRRILALTKAIGSGYRSAAEIMEKMGLSSRTNFLRNYMRPAIECGLVEMSNPDKPLDPTQKYRSNLF